jgi:hypothetical protein
VNKSSPEYIRVREEIAQFLHKIEREAYPSAELPVIFENLSKEMQADFYSEVDSILSIKGIAILSDNQTLPNFDSTSAQSDMLNANFKKVVE